MASRGQAKHYVYAYKYAMLKALGFPCKEEDRKYCLSAYFESLTQSEKVRLEERCKKAAEIVKRRLPNDEKYIELWSSGWRPKRNFDLVIHDEEFFQMGLEIGLAVDGLVKNVGFSMPVYRYFDIGMEYVAHKEDRVEYAKEWQSITHIVDKHSGNWTDFNYREEVILPTADLLFKMISSIYEGGVDAFAHLYEYRFGEKPILVVTFKNDEIEVYSIDMYGSGIVSKRSNVGTGIVLKRGDCLANVLVRLASRNIDVKRIMIEVSFKSNMPIRESMGTLDSI